MPTFDGGHYFLTALIPIRTDMVQDQRSITSPVHALSKRLDMLATAMQTPGCRGESPFARNTRNHFVRLVIIHDVAYNGREQGNTLLSIGVDLVVAQPQDHLSCPFLLLAVDFDAASGADIERDSYLATLWQTMETELRGILTFCRGFDGRVNDAAAFAKYIADCQFETTMSFNDYYADPPKLPNWPSSVYKWIGIAILAPFALSVVAALVLFVAEMFVPPWVTGIRTAVLVAVVTAVGLGALILIAYLSLMAAGAKPFPTAPDSNLPAVLKALYLQRAFTRFAIDSQMDAAGSDAASAQRLHDNFATFLAVNKPSDLSNPTQAPGVIGI
ncbi:MAG: hypothetical protein WAL80_25895 [Xanthobacteraceae bacterium]